MVRKTRLLFIVLLLTAALFLLYSPPFFVPDAERQGGITTYEGIVVSETESGSRPSVLTGQSEPYQIVNVRLMTGDRKGEVVTAENVLLDPTFGNTTHLRPRDRVVVDSFLRSDSEEFVVIDYVRWPALTSLAILFAAATVLVGGMHGVRSLGGLTISFLVITMGILPQLLEGRNPIVVSVVGAMVIMLVTLYLSHGVNWKTTTAVLGIVVSLTLTAVLGWTFIQVAHMSGMTSEEVMYLQLQGGGRLNLQGLLLAGIIIGTLGVLDDVTVNQAAVIFALRAANPRYDWRALYRRGMSVGRDHIASTVNTLVLAYTGAALPLVLLFVGYEVPFLDLINREIFAAEILQTLVGSLGLVVAVPVTTLLAVYASRNLTSKQIERIHGVRHDDTHPHIH